MITTASTETLATRIGTELGVSDYETVTQDVVDAFADATGDRQWIHTDPVRAAASPFGGTIAHGYLVLSLAPALLDQVLPLGIYSMVINYGLDKVRFTAPLPVGASVRMRVALDAFEAVPGGSALSLTFTFERPSGGKPVCVAQAIYRVYE